MLQTILENIMRYPANLFNRHPSHEEPVLKKKGKDYAVTSTTLIGLQCNFADRSWPPTVYFMAFMALGAGAAAFLAFFMAFIAFGMVKN